MLLRSEAGLALMQGKLAAEHSPVPIMATGEFPFLGFPPSPASTGGGGIHHRLRRCFNRSSYRLVSLLKWRQDARVIQAFCRDRLALEPMPWGGARPNSTA